MRHLLIASVLLLTPLVSAEPMTELPLGQYHGSLFDLKNGIAIPTGELSVSVSADRQTIQFHTDSYEGISGDGLIGIKFNADGTCQETRELPEGLEAFRLKGTCRDNQVLLHSEFQNGSERVTSMTLEFSWYKDLLKYRYILINKDKTDAGVQTTEKEIKGVLKKH